MNKSLLVFLLVASVTAPFPDAAGADKDSEARRQFERELRIYNSRPARRDGPLRYENVSDQEVREIQGAVATIDPGALVNIGGVVTGCNCEESDACTDQVWVVAYHPDNSHGYMVSRIGGHWSIGALQGWWLRNEALQAKWRLFYKSDGPEQDRKAQRDALYQAQEKLRGEFPHCSAPNALAHESPKR